MVTDRPNRAMKTTDSTRTGTPLASATSGLTEANNSGRYTTATTPAMSASAAAKVSNCWCDTARRLPKSTLVTVLLLLVAKELKNNPSPVAAASSSLVGSRPSSSWSAPAAPPQ